MCSFNITIIFCQIVKPSKNEVKINNTIEKIKDEVLEPTESKAKRKYENEDVNEITLLNGLCVPKDGSVPVKKRKKVATADKMLKLEQEKGCGILQ